MPLPTLSRAAQTAIEGEVATPVIAPAASSEWAEASRTSPRAISRLASSRVVAQPSSMTAPQIALLCGWHIRSHSTGGPACRTVRPSSPGMTSCGAGAHDHRPRLLQARQRTGVRLADTVVAVGRREDGDVLRVAPRGRAPVERRHIRALVPERLGHEVQAGGDDA